MDFLSEILNKNSKIYIYNGLFFKFLISFLDQKTLQKYKKNCNQSYLKKIEKYFWILKTFGNKIWTLKVFKRKF